MSKDNKWDKDCYYSAGFSPMVRFDKPDAIGITDGLGITADRDRMEWPVSWEQLQSWGLRVGNTCRAYPAVERARKLWREGRADIGQQA